MSRAPSQAVRSVAIVAALACGAYALLWQRQPFENEVLWFDLVRGVGEPMYVRPAWQAILVRADAMAGVVAPHTLVCWLSALCAATGLFVFGLIVRRTEPEMSAAGTTLVLATCPAVLCAATSAQPYALVFALAGVATFLTTLANARGRWLALALAGATAGGAYAFDVSALLIATWLLPLVAVQSLRGDRPRWSAVAGAGLVGATFAVVVAWICVRDLAPAPTTEVLVAAGNKIHAYDPVRLLDVAGKEALRAFLPLSLVVLAYAFAIRGRLARITVLGAIAGSVATAWLRGIRPMEGALMLALVLPAGLVVARHLRVRGRGILIVVGAVLGLLKLDALAGDGHARAFWSGLQSHVPTRNVVLLTSSDGPDHVACALWLPQVKATRVRQLVLLASERPDELRGLVVQHVGNALAEGQRVFLTHDAEALLRSPDYLDGFPAAAILLRTLLDDFRVAQREEGGFRAKELLPRDGR